MDIHHLLANCRRIFLRDFEVITSIGIHDFEKKSPQRVLFNVDLFVTLESTHPSNDQLHELVDYDFIRTTIKSVVERGHIHLQETLCDQLIEALCAHPQVVAARVSTMKPDVYPDCAGVGIEVFHTNLSKI